MKTFRFLLASGLSLLGASVLSAAPTSAPKAQTYTLAGFCTRGKPPANLVEQAGIRLEDVGNARGDLEGDRDVGDGCPCREPESVAEEDLV